MRAAIVAVLVAILAAGCGPQVPTAAAGITDTYWVKLATNPPIPATQSWEAPAVPHDQFEPWILDYGEHYLMFYYAGPKGIYDDTGVMVITKEQYRLDPTAWTKYAHNPIIGHGAFVSRGFPMPILMPDNSVRLYIQETPSSGVTQISLVTFTAAQVAAIIAGEPCGPGTEYAGNPILTHGPPGAWDDFSVQIGFIVGPADAPDNVYHLFYGGNTGGNTSGTWRVGHITSEDGLAWSNAPVSASAFDPVPGTWRAGWTYPYGFVKVNGIFNILYIGTESYAEGEWRTGWMTSADLSTFADYSSNPVIGPGPPGTWDQRGFSGRSIVYDPEHGIFDMWGIGNDGVLDSGFLIGLARAGLAPTTGILGAYLFGATMY